MAWSAATSAEASTWPFSTGPSRIALAVVGRRRMVPVATARRFTSGFRPMSTIFAIASGWVAALFLPAPLSTLRRGQPGSMGHATRGRRLLSSRNVGREKHYVRCPRLKPAACGLDARARRDGMGDRSAARLETILLRATDRHATQRTVGDANIWQA